MKQQLLIPFKARHAIVVTLYVAACAAVALVIYSLLHQPRFQNVWWAVAVITISIALIVILGAVIAFKIFPLPELRSVQLDDTARKVAGSFIVQQKDLDSNFPPARSQLAHPSVNDSPELIRTMADLQLML